MVSRRQDLISALVACAESASRARIRRFVTGLSADELQFVAEYLGSCILEATRPATCSRAELAGKIARFQQVRSPSAGADEDHKMILLLEFLCRAGIHQLPLPAHAPLSASPDIHF